jgi:tRNA A37 threonylcarbamoyladenosine dehydratase
MKAKNSTRQDRLAAALRENLKRRKARARALEAVTGSKAAETSEARPNKVKKVD